MEQSDSWAEIDINPEIFAPSEHDKIDITIKKEHDLIIYLFRKSMLKTSNHQLRIDYLNKAAKNIASHCISEEQTIHPLIAQHLSIDIAVDKLVEHREFRKKVRDLAKYFNEYGETEEFFKILKTSIRYFEDHFKKEEDEEVTSCLSKLDENEVCELSREYLELRNLEIFKLAPAIGDIIFK